MKYLFLLNIAPYISEYLGSLSKELYKKNNEIIIYINSEIAKLRYLKNYENKAVIYERNKMKVSDHNSSNFNWKLLFESWDRNTLLNIFSNYEYTKENMLKTYYDLDYILNKEKIDIIIQEPPANLLTETAYFLSKKYKIKYLGLIQSRIPDRIDIYDEKYSNSIFKKINLKSINLTEEEKTYYINFNKKFLNHSIKPSYLKAEVNNIHKLNLFKYYSKKLHLIFKYISLKNYLLKNKLFYDYESNVVLKFPSLRKNIVRKLTRNNHKRFIDNIENLNDKNFFIFPLHLQPEASTSGQATYFSELLTTIKYISFSLPFPYVLAVKEHPSAIGTRSNRFYKELKKIPNVVLLSPEENNEFLIENSKGVITLTSTLGLEAALKGKKVLVLGDVFYDFHPNCFKIKNYEEIEKIILKEKVKYSEEELEIINAKFWKLYKSITIEGSIFNKEISKNQIEEFKRFSN